MVHPCRESKSAWALACTFCCNTTVSKFHLIECVLMLQRQSNGKVQLLNVTNFHPCYLSKGFGMAEKSIKTFMQLELCKRLALE